MAGDGGAGRHARPFGARCRGEDRHGQGAGQPRGGLAGRCRAACSAPPDADDGRITRLSLTASGRAIYDEIVPLALHLEEVLLAALSPGERETLSALMEKFAGRVRTFMSPAP